MKTLTEFDGFTLKRGLQKLDELAAQSKTAEEIPALLTEAFKYEGDKLKFFQNALEIAKARGATAQDCRIKRVVVFSLAEGEKAPSGVEQREMQGYLHELFPAPPRPQKGRGRFEDKGGRGGKGRGKGKRGGRGGGRGDRPNRNGPGGERSGGPREAGGGGGGRPDNRGGQRFDKNKQRGPRPPQAGKPQQAPAQQAAPANQPAAAQTAAPAASSSGTESGAS